MKQSRLAWTALLSVTLVSQGVLAQGLGTSPRGTGIGQDTTTPVTRNADQHHASGAQADSNASPGQPRLKGHHEGASAAHGASGPARSSKMSQ